MQKKKLKIVLDSFKVQLSSVTHFKVSFLNGEDQIIFVQSGEKKNNRATSIPQFTLSLPPPKKVFSKSSHP